MPVRQQWTLGTVLKVPFDTGWHAYAWSLPDVTFAFFDIKTNCEKTIDEIIKLPIVFSVAVHKSAWSTGRWRKIGKKTLPPELLEPIPMFMEDAISGKFRIYRQGKISPATREECIGLQRASVWDPEHVEQRLRDHFANRPCVWCEMDRLD